MKAEMQTQTQLLHVPFLEQNSGMTPFQNTILRIYIMKMNIEIKYHNSSKL